MRKHLGTILLVFGSTIGVALTYWWASRPIAPLTPDARPSPVAIQDSDSAHPEKDARPSPPMRSSSGTGKGEVGGTTPVPVPTALERFRQITGEAMAALPRVDELKNISEEDLHSRPAPLQRAGAALGRISQALEADGGLKPEAIRFYAECAGKAELLQTVRAVCYRDLLSLGGDDHLVAVPDGVKRLASEIP